MLVGVERVAGFGWTRLDPPSPELWRGKLGWSSPEINLVLSVVIVGCVFCPRFFSPARSGGERSEPERSAGLKNHFHVMFRGPQCISCGVAIANAVCGRL
jgi:hypothetical protein